MIDRRNLLRGALLGAGASMFSSKVLASAGKALGIAGLPPTNHQLLFVFQRGGNDGVNTLIPMRDLTYPQARPTLKITNGIQLPGIPYSRLNPNLERLVQIVRERHAPVETGRFGANMQVSLVNDGPVTFWLES